MQYFFILIFHGNKRDAYFKDAALIPAVFFPLSILPLVFPSLLFVFVLPPSIRRVSIRAAGAKGRGGHFTLYPGSEVGYSSIHTILVGLNLTLFIT